METKVERRKMEWMNQLYIYIWKCQNETPCIAILNKQMCGFYFFAETKNKKVKQDLSGDGTSGRGADVRKG
jgi:hypothetical protein